MSIICTFFVDFRTKCVMYFNLWLLNLRKLSYLLFLFNLLFFSLCLFVYNFLLFDVVPCKILLDVYFWKLVCLNTQHVIVCILSALDFHLQEHPPLFWVVPIKAMGLCFKAFEINFLESLIDVLFVHWSKTRTDAMTKSRLYWKNVKRW
jgi:hypothetical protein